MPDTILVDARALTVDEVGNEFSALSERLMPIRVRRSVDNIASLLAAETRPSPKPAPRSKTSRRFGVNLSACITALTLPVLPALAQELPAEVALSKSIPAHRAEVAPIIDGRLEEEIWNGAATVEDFHQILPNEYSPPTEHTTVYVLYDENALYVAARMPQVNTPVQATRLRQGDVYWGDDLFSVLLSPFNDERSGYRFQVNSNGVRMEALAQDTTDELWEWSGIWQAAVATDADGWTAEIAIPFKTLSFNPEDDTWGINFRRDVGSRDERIGWSSFNRTQNPSSAGTLVGLSGMELGRGLDVVPSISLRQRKDYVPVEHSEFDPEPSLDVFYKLSPSLNGSLTFNTDFSATEVDDRQVNLTRFNLFFPEKRDFFLVDADIFRFGRIGRIRTAGFAPAGTFSRPSLENGQPFFSRRIGLSESGQPVDLNYGGKLSGRVGRWNVGALAIQQDEFGDVEKTDLFVGRVAANVLAESSLGMIVTNGDPRSNSDNSVVGADFRYFNTRLSGGRSLQGDLWVQKSDSEGLEGDNAAWGFRLLAPNSVGLRGGVAVKELQANFNPALGLVNRRDIRDHTAEIGHTWRFRRPYLRSYYSGIDAQRIEKIDGDLESEIVTLRVAEFETNRRDRYLLRYYSTTEVLNDPFVIWQKGPTEIVIPSGEYSFDEAEFSTSFGEQRNVFGSFSVRSGDFYDGKRQALSGEIGWRPSIHFATALSYETNDVELPGGRFISRLTQFRTDVIFSSTLSWVTLLQYDNVTESIGINSRLHWIPEAGREAFIVLNHNLQNLDPLTSNTFNSAAADLTIKYNYTFRF